MPATGSPYTRSYGTITGTGVALPDGTYVPNGYMPTTRSIAGVSIPALLLAAAVAVLLFKRGRLI